MCVYVCVCACVRAYVCACVPVCSCMSLPEQAPHLQGKHVNMVLCTNNCSEKRDYNTLATIRDVYHHQLLLSIITSSNYHDTIFITIFILTFVLMILMNKTASYHLIFIFTLQSLYFIMCVSLKIISEPLLLPPGSCFKCSTGLPLLVKMLYVHKLN